MERGRLTCVDKGEACRARVGGSVVDGGVKHVGESDSVGQGNEGRLACKTQVDELDVEGASVDCGGLRERGRVQGATAQVVRLLSLQQCLNASGCDRVEIVQHETGIAPHHGDQWVGSLTMRAGIVMSSHDNMHAHLDQLCLCERAISQTQSY